jgi:hypothetical protein
MRLTTHMRVAVAALAVAAFIGAGCGGDDDDEATSASGSSADDSGGLTGPPAAAAAFCDAAVAVDTASLGLESGDTTPGDFEQALHAVEEAAPGEIAESVGVMTIEARSLMAEAEAAQGDEGPPPIPSDEFFAASVDVGGYLSDTCDLETVDVTAKNYEFQGIPDTVPAGVTVLNFTNAGTEFHEIALMKLPEGEERSVEELLAVPETEQPETTDKAFVLAPPGAATYVTADLDPGRYVALCFVPIGATPEALQSGTALNEEDGHFMHGMITEFTVS